MELKLITGLSGPEYTLSPGDVTDRFSKKEARRLIEAGIAEPYDGPPLSPVEQQIAAAISERDALHVAAVSASDAAHAEEIAKLKTDHEAALQKAVEDALAASNAAHAEEIAQLKTDHEAAVQKAVEDANVAQKEGQ